MNEGLIPKRYAKALFKVALERGDADALYATMDTLARSFAANPRLQETVANPFLADDKKTALLLTAAGNAGAAGRTYADFLKLLAENRRLPMARAAALAYLDIYRQANNIYPVKVVSAEPLDKEERARLESLIGKHLRGGTVEYDFSVDPSLIGGFTVSIGSERLDASVENELKQLRLRLLSKI
ncbi:ATP synthase F1 subunit delta [Muribaculaceae bacterium Isolate-013 (NCI)]|nr:ATP synthase F1 subunit delta [Muribaculaceae bacterium Isolate-013 (NCI)]